MGYVDTVLKVLRSVCYCCSRVLLSDEDASALTGGGRDGKLLFGVVYNAARGKKRCVHCGMPQPAYHRHNGVIRLEWAKDALELVDDDAEPGV